jgi:rod shape determining protein RodA
MPVTGLPLPFLSYGGTSLLSWMAMTGLLLNVHQRRR